MYKYNLNELWYHCADNDILLSTYESTSNTTPPVKLSDKYMFITTTNRIVIWLYLWLIPSYILLYAVQEWFY